jgi:hypothetical protein
MAFAIIMLILLAFLMGWTIWYLIDFKKNGKSDTADLKKVAEIFDSSMKKSFSEAVNLRNNIDHCPKCGSHNIKLYRKGYNYKVGFWGAIFGVRGAGYAGGFGANNTCCRCMDCGNDWETDYDYRLIVK